MTIEDIIEGLNFDLKNDNFNNDVHYLQVDYKNMIDKSDLNDMDKSKCLIIVSQVISNYLNDQ